MNMRLSFTSICVLCGLLGLMAGRLLAAPQTFELETSTGSGGIYLTNVNNEEFEPNTPSGKDFDYPYYFDAIQGLWVVIASEPLNASYTYAYEEANFTVKNKTETAANPGSFSIGQVSWDDALLSGSGVEFLGFSDFTLNLDGADFSPINSPRNVNNEFAWDYGISVASFTSGQLTFIDGTLSSIDIDADIEVTPQFLGNPALGFTNSYDGTVAFSGNSFAFAVDVIQNNGSALGGLTDTHLVFDAAGSLVGVPEPAATVVVFGLTAWLALFRRPHHSRAAFNS